MKTGRFTKTTALCSVFRFGIGFRLPLHVARSIAPTARERSYVVDHITRTTMRIAGLLLEFVLCLCATFDLSLLVPLDADRGLLLGSQRGTNHDLGCHH